MYLSQSTVLSRKLFLRIADLVRRFEALNGVKVVVTNLEYARFWCMKRAHSPVGQIPEGGQA